ncbi:hypothetical protein FBU31_001367, partial [Coemansia sp. 'formosensis']
MNRLFSSYKRNLVIATSLAVLGVLGYLALEAFQEPEQPPPAAVEEEEVIIPATPIRKKNKRVLAISARGIVLESNDDDDKWSADVRIRSSSALAIRRLLETYEVYLVAVVRSEGDQKRVQEVLESSGARVLFCQTEEGKMHLVRHLLTHSQSGGYMDTNRDVVRRLSQVLSRVVLVTTGDISGGDVPGSNTAFEMGEEGSSKPLVGVEQIKEIKLRSSSWYAESKASRASSLLRAFDARQKTAAAVSRRRSATRKRRYASHGRVSAS